MHIVQLRMWQWNAWTSYRRSAFVGLIGLSAPLNYKYMALDCVTFNIISSFIRIGDDLLRVILWQILHLISSKVKHPLRLKPSTLFCSQSIPNLMRATSKDGQGLNNPQKSEMSFQISFVRFCYTLTLMQPLNVRYVLWYFYPYQSTPARL